jgi:hypothetical protein
MALMLAPYNSAMRLGMGFNSYTQTLCVNDVVRKAGSVRATEGDLRAAQLTSKTDAATAQTKRLTTEETSPAQGVLNGASGTVSRKLVDGQKEVSQVVSWEATFIENSSDILKKLDVSGMLLRSTFARFLGLTCNQAHSQSRWLAWANYLARLASSTRPTSRVPTSTTSSMSESSTSAWLRTT